MKFLTGSAYAYSGAALLVLAGGCANGGAPVSTEFLTQSAKTAHESRNPSSTVSSSVPDVALGVALKNGTVVVAHDRSSGNVAVYTLAGKLIAAISGLSSVSGFAADTAGDIYFAATNSSTIPLYKNDYKTLLATLSDRGQSPVAVAFDSTSGTVGVVNALTTAGGNGSVSIYAKGVTVPCTTVGGNSFARLYFGAFDDNGDLYVDGTDSNGSTVVGVVKGGCKATTISPLTTANIIGFPGGIQITPNDEIAVDDQSSATIDTYRQLINGRLGTPVSTTSLVTAGDPVSFTLTTKAQQLWTADAAHSRVLEYNYPAGGRPLQSLNFYEPLGVVVTPLERP